MAEKTPVAVLISGSGTNLQALIDACKDPEYPAEIVLVISNKADSYGLQRAKDAHIKTCVISHKDYASREEFDHAMASEIDHSGAQYICLAGFMRLLTKDFVERYLGRMINIHPSLLPAFKGAHAQRDAIAACVRISGCTTHFVVPEMDAGPIIMQAAVPVYPSDNQEDLSARTLPKEHECYVKSLSSVINQDVILSKDGDKAIWMS